MWDCTFCGCRMIAASLTFCPMCRKDREVPKITTDGGPTNASAAEGEPGYVAPEAPPAEVAAAPAADPAPVSEVVPETAPEPVAAEGGITLPPIGAVNG